MRDKLIFLWTLILSLSLNQIESVKIRRDQPYDPLANFGIVTRYKWKTGGNPFANFTIPNRKQYYLKNPSKVLEITNKAAVSEERLTEYEQEVVSFTEDVFHNTSFRNLVILGSPNWYDINENQYPYRTVGLFSYMDGNNGYYCTATLIKRNMIITAGHCAGSFDQSWISSIKFYPAYRTKDYSYMGKVSRALKARRNVQFDGLVILLQKFSNGPSKGNTFVGDLVGWMGRKYLSRAGFVQQPITACMVGYGRKAGCPSSKGACQAAARCCLIAAYRGNFAVTQCDTSHGDSGSSYYVTNSGNPYVVVIHSGGICGTGYLQGDESTEICNGDYSYSLRRYNVGGAMGDLKSALLFTGVFS